MENIHIDEHGQPESTAFNYYQNRVKALNCLQGILEGIASDTIVDESEIAFLEAWMNDSELLFQNRLLRELKFKVEALCENPVDFQGAFLDVMQSIQFLIESDERLQLKLNSEDAMETLLGICKGIDADRKLDDEEVSYLATFLEENAQLQSSWPASELYVFIRDILMDGVITPNERSTLQKFIRSIIGDGLSKGLPDGMSTVLPVDHGTKIVFLDRSFCLTGKFLHGSRNECKELIEERGGLVVNAINKRLHYLVVGALSSRDWKFSNYGRKIEKAVEYRDEKQCMIRIVSEEMWLGSM